MPHLHGSAAPTFSTADDVTLAGRRWFCSGRPRAAVVLAHGFTASAHHPDVSAVAEALHANGLDVITYDARGHGASGGESTLGDAERHDVAAAVAAARERSDRVVTVGASMGAIAVLRHAALDPDLDGVVSVSCPSRWRLPLNAVGILSTLMTRTRPGRAFAARFARVRIAARWSNPAPPIDLVSSIRAPLALVHGRKDPFIGVCDAQELYASATGPRRLVLVDGMGHAFGLAAVASIVAAVDWTLASSRAHRTAV